jgi:hypothetical protein
MEEKINNKKIFNYIPSLILKLILDNPLKDKDVFCEQNKSIFKTNNNIFIHPNIFPIINELPSALIMKINLGGFEKLISTLILKDQKNQKEKIISEYLSIITPRILLKISSIISEYCGEIIEYNDFELTVIWTNNNNKNIKYNKYNCKLALLTAIEIINKVDKTEISSEVELELSISLSLGSIYCIFFGGERKRTECVFMGEAMKNAQKGLMYCYSHEIIFDKNINEIFQKTGEISSLEIDDKSEFFSLMDYNEEDLKDFKNFKGFKLKNNNLCINKAFYENLSNKIHIAYSVIPSVFVKYLDLGVETNLQEINILTVETIYIYLEPELSSDLSQIQCLIFDIQKSIYLMFGIIIHIYKALSGFTIRCVWGIGTSSFIDDTARAISTASLIGNLSKYYKIKLGIGIATGSCFSGLINLQGNKKVYTLLGKKVTLSKILAEECLRNILNTNEPKNYLIYCDKNTMKYSQKWYRHILVNKLKIHLVKKNDILYKYKINFIDNINKDNINNNMNLNKRNTNLNKINLEKISNDLKINRKEEFFEGDNKNKIKGYDNDNNLVENKFIIENKYNLINEIYTPIEEEEYFIPSYYDPFPLIRTHLNNSYSAKNKLYFKNVLQITNNDTIDDSKTPKIKTHSMSTVSLHKAQKHQKMMLKLKKSQTIFGNSIKIKKILSILNYVYRNNLRQFFLIKGPLGIGKTLFIRKVLNNFIGSNDFLSKYYFTKEQYLFCNLVKPLNRVLSFNTVNYILRELFLNIKKIDKINELFNIAKNLNLTNENLKTISLILSIGKNDINLEQDFAKDKDKKKINKIKDKNKSYIKDIEGPYAFKDKAKLYEFFYNMIIIYKAHLLDKAKNDKLIIKKKENNKLPLILVIDDVHYSDIYSIEFIQYLFDNKNSLLNPFIVFLIEQTPFNEKFPPLTNPILEKFFIFASEFCDKPKEDTIIKYEIKSLIEKNDIQKLIIFYNKETIMNKYKTNLESVDDKILEFILMKTFNGIPLLVLSLSDALIKSEKFIQKLSGEFIITSELIDDNILHDWSDLLLPYIYEKIDSNMINTLLNFKEILLLKYASIIGNIFDMKTLEKLNPLKTVIKISDIENILYKLNSQYLLEIYYPEIESFNNKNSNIICLLTFPLMREILHQKFPMERRAVLHMKIAKFLSTSKKKIYFNIENELKILKRHLLYSEMNIINEIESKDIRTVQDILQNKKVLNYNNLKLYIVKEIFSKFYSNYKGNILEGNLEIFFNYKWLKISYFIDKNTNICITSNNPEKDKNEIIMIIPINSIYKNKISKNIKNLSKMKCSSYILIIYQSLIDDTLKTNSKNIILFSSEQREEICKLDIAINFLRVKVNYDKYITNYGKTQFPLYKTKWYKQKKLLFYSQIEQNGISIQDINSMNLINPNYVRFSDTYNEKMFNNKTKIIKSSLTAIFHTSFSIFLGCIQERLTKLNKTEKIIQIHNYTYDFSLPKHIKKKINYFLRLSINKDLNQKLTRLNHAHMRKSVCLDNNPYKNIFNLKKKLEKSEDSEDDLYSEKSSEKDDNFKIRTINKKNTINIKMKNKKLLNGKINATFNVQNKNILNPIIEESNSKNENNDITILNKKNSLNIAKSSNNTEIIINNKKENIDDDNDSENSSDNDDLNINEYEFTLEDDDTINISINNITNIINTSNYIDDKYTREETKQSSDNIYNL